MQNKITHEELGRERLEILMVQRATEVFNRGVTEITKNIDVRVTEKLQEIEKKRTENVKQFFETKTQEDLNSIVRNATGAELTKLDNRINVITETINNAIDTGGNFFAITSRLTDLFDQIAQIKDKLRDYDNKIAFMRANDYLPVSKEEILKLWVLADIQIKDVERDFNCSNSHAWRLSAADVKDQRILHKFKEYLIGKIEQQKEKQNAKKEREKAESAVSGVQHT